MYESSSFFNRKGCYIAMQFRNEDSAKRTNIQESRKMLQFHFAMEFDN